MHKNYLQPVILPLVLLSSLLNQIFIKREKLLDFFKRNRAYLNPEYNVNS
jgi:hypothetical protein